MPEQGPYILSDAAERIGDELAPWVSMRPFPRGTALRYDARKGDAGAENTGR